MNPEAIRELVFVFSQGPQTQAFYSALLNCIYNAMGGGSSGAFSKHVTKEELELEDGMKARFYLKYPHDAWDEMCKNYGKGN